MSPQTKIQLSMQPDLYSKIKEMAEFYSLPIPEMQRKIYIDYYNNIYRKDALGYFGGIKTTGANIDRKKGKQNLEEIINSIHTLPPEEAMQLVRDIGYITSKHEEDNGCTYVIAGEDENRDLWMVYGPDSKSACFGSWAYLASDIRKHLKTIKK